MKRNLLYLQKSKRVLFVTIYYRHRKTTRTPRSVFGCGFLSRFFLLPFPLPPVLGSLSPFLLFKETEYNYLSNADDCS